MAKLQQVRQFHGVFILQEVVQTWRNVLVAEPSGTALGYGLALQYPALCDLTSCFLLREVHFAVLCVPIPSPLAKAVVLMI